MNDATETMTTKVMGMISKWSDYPTADIYLDGARIGRVALEDGERLNTYEPRIEARYSVTIYLWKASVATWWYQNKRDRDVDYKNCATFYFPAADFPSARKTKDVPENLKDFVSRVVTGLVVE